MWGRSLTHTTPVSDPHLPSRPGQSSPPPPPPAPPHEAAACARRACLQARGSSRGEWSEAVRRQGGGCAQGGPGRGARGGADQGFVRSSCSLPRAPQGTHLRPQPPRAAYRAARAGQAVLGRGRKPPRAAGPAGRRCVIWGVGRGVAEAVADGGVPQRISTTSWGSAPRSSASTRRAWGKGRPRQRRHLWHPCCPASATRHALQGTWTNCRLPYPTARLRRGAALPLPRGRGRAGLEEQQMCGPASLSGPARARIWRPHVSPRPLPPPPVPCRHPAPCSMSTLRHRRHCSTAPLIQRAVQACCRESESGGQLLGVASPAWSMRVAHTRHGMTPQDRFRVRPAVPARPGPGFGERPRCSRPVKKLIQSSESQIPIQIKSGPDYQEAPKQPPAGPAGHAVKDPPA